MRQNPNNCSRSVLLVEDDARIRHSLQLALEAEGYNVTVAINGKDALDVLISPEKPCVVLLDMMMPVMNGREFLDIMKEDSELAEIPVIILSAIAEKVIAKGAAAVIKKPFELTHVLNTIENFCQPPIVQ